MIEIENREYFFIASIVMRKPSNQAYSKPQDDVVKWFYAKLDDSVMHTCIYKIIDSALANYSIPFKAKISLLDKDIVGLFTKAKQYKIYRGQEEFGTIELIQVL
jgi:hypothetical protein